MSSFSGSTVMVSRKNVLTTGEVARICNVAPRTVSKWFDSGQLRGYRIPGSKDRRIPLDQLVRFMRAHNIPLNGLESGRLRLLVMDGDISFGENLREVLQRDGGFEVALATGALEAGAAAAGFKPHAVIVDVASSVVTARDVVRFVRTLPQTPTPCLIGMGKDLDDSRGQALLQEGFGGYLSKPFDARALIRLLEINVAVEPSPGAPPIENN